jgi:isopentenyldiphosphate isomerase
MKIPIVDEHDEIISYKERSDLDYNHDIFRTASLWIMNNNNEVLLAQRKFDKKVDPGKWAEAVGGTVEGNDSYLSTITREATEELGLRDLKVVVGPKQFITVPCRYFVQWYETRIDKPITDFKIQKEEVEQIVWIPLVQLQNELMTNPNKYIEVMSEIVKLFTNINTTYI